MDTQDNAVNDFLHLVDLIEIFYKSRQDIWSNVKKKKRYSNLDYLSLNCFFTFD